MVHVCLSIVLGNVLKTVAGSLHEGQVRDSEVIEAGYEHDRAEDEEGPQTVQVLFVHPAGGDEEAADEGDLEG